MRERGKNKMKSKWKYVIYMVLIVLLGLFVTKYLINIGDQKNSVPITSYTVAVVETSKQAKKNIITYYDSNLQEKGKQDISHFGLCEDVEPMVYDNKVYLVAAGKQMVPSNIVLEIDLTTGEQKEYSMPNNSTISDFCIDDENMYIVHNLNNVTYIRAVNRKTGEERKIELNESKESNVMNLDLKDDVLYAFGDNFDYNDKVPSFIYEIDVDTFSIENKIDVTSYGESLVSSCFYGDNLYLAFAQFEDNTELEYICEYSLKTKKIRKIKVEAKEPIQIKEYNGLIYIVNSDKHNQEDQSSSISIYNPQNGNINNIKFGKHITYIDFIDGKMFLYGNNMLSIYRDENGKFIFEKEKDVYTQKNSQSYYWVSGFFLKSLNVMR